MNLTQIFCGIRTLSCRMQSHPRIQWNTRSRIDRYFDFKKLVEFFTVEGYPLSRSAPWIWLYFHLIRRCANLESKVVSYFSFSLDEIVCSERKPNFRWVYRGSGSIQMVHRSHQFLDPPENPAAGFPNQTGVCYKPNGILRDGGLFASLRVFCIYTFIGFLFPSINHSIDGCRHHFVGFPLDGEWNRISSRLFSKLSFMKTSPVFKDMVSIILAITFLIFSYNEMMPRVSYIKAMDVYLGVCFMIVFLSLIKLSFFKYLRQKLKISRWETVEEGEDGGTKFIGIKPWFKDSFQFCGLNPR